MMRILLADDESNVRFALRVLLEPRPGWCIAGEAGDVEGLLAQIEASCPDLVLLDWGMAALDLLLALRAACPSLYVIVLSGRPEARRASLEAGADAFVGKTDPPEQLLAAIQSAERARAARILEEKQG
jgi:DNA-binding NarL/FixJ family response regulator